MGRGSTWLYEQMCRLTLETPGSETTPRRCVTQSAIVFGQPFIRGYGVHTHSYSTCTFICLYTIYTDLHLQILRMPVLGVPVFMCFRCDELSEPSGYIHIYLCICMYIYKETPCAPITTVKCKIWESGPAMRAGKLSCVAKPCVYNNLSLSIFFVLCCCAYVYTVYTKLCRCV